MLECDCGKQYVGRTSGELEVRVREYIANIKRGKKEHSVPKHFRIAHNKDPSTVRFWKIERVTKHWRGGNSKRQISQCWVVQEQRSSTVDAFLYSDCM